MDNGIKSKLKDTLKKYKLIILAASVGLALLLIPTGTKDEGMAMGDEERLERLLEAAQGIGDAKVLISESGAVIVCEGASSADTRLTVLKAASAFTGLPADKIQVLKMEMED